MMITIYKNYWMEIFKDRAMYIIRYNTGDHFNRTKERIVTEEEAMRAQESDDAAMEILDKYDNIELFGEDYMIR